MLPLFSIFFLLSVLNGYTQSVAEQNVLCKECPETIKINKIGKGQKLDSLQYQQFDKTDNSWKTVLQTTFEYNSQHQLISESNIYQQDHFDNYSNGGTSGKSKHLYTYNKKGQLITDVFQYEEHAEPQVLENEEYPSAEILTALPFKAKIKGRYKENEYGRAYVVEEYERKGAYKSIYTYNKKGQLNSVLYQVKEGENFKDYSRLIYGYNHKSKLISESLSFMDSSYTAWKLYQEEKNSYDKSGVKISSVTKRMYDPSGEKAYLYLSIQGHYIYNTSGMLIKEVHQQSIDSVWEDYEQIITTINVKPNTMEVLKQSADGGVWYNSLLVKSQTDANGNILNSVTLEPQYEEWFTLSLQSYSYDKNNNRASYLEEPLKEPEFSDSFRCQYFYSVQ